MEKKYSIEEVFNLIGEEYLLRRNQIGRIRKDKDNDVIVDGYIVKRNSLRYMTFYQKGTTCVCCGRQGAYFKLDIGDSHSKYSNRRHFNLYSEDGILMTKDHINPQSKGGRNNIENMQTMCSICNSKKADKMDVL